MGEGVVAVMVVVYGSAFWDTALLSLLLILLQLGTE
jgi:hypothetical protein